MLPSDISFIHKIDGSTRDNVDDANNYLALIMFHLSFSNCLQIYLLFLKFGLEIHHFRKF